MAQHRIVPLFASVSSSSIMPEGEKKSRHQRFAGTAEAGLTASGRDSQATYLMASYGSVNPQVSRRCLERAGPANITAAKTLICRVTCLRVGGMVMMTS